MSVGTDLPLEVRRRVPWIVAAILVMATVGCAPSSPDIMPRAHPAPASVRPVAIEVPGADPVDFVLIQPGQFTMGENDRFARIDSMWDELWHMKFRTNEGPEHRVTVTKPFHMAVHEVTSAQYCAFLNEISDPAKYVVHGSCASVHLDGDRWVPTAASTWQFDRDAKQVALVRLPTPSSDVPRLAVNCATWEGARAFAAWLSAKSGRTVRLPTEAEWELAARGIDGRPDPWGWEEPYDPQARTNRRKALGYPTDSPSGDVTPEGVTDLAGSVAEWTNDWYFEEYPAGHRIDPTGPPSGEGRVLRGRWGTSTGRDCVPPAVYHQLSVLGVRLVLEP